MTTQTWYEVHWARANAADQLSALRPDAIRHASAPAAQDEAARLSSPWPDLTPVVVPVCIADLPARDI